MSDGYLTANEGAAESPLHAAARAGDAVELKRLVAAGVDVNWRDSRKETALFGAAAWCRCAKVVAHASESTLSIN